MTQEPADARTTVDYPALFAATPTAYLVLSPDLVIVEANPAYLTRIGRTRDQLIGRGVFDAFPPTPDAIDQQGRNTLELSFVRVRDTGRAEVLPLYQYDVHDGTDGMAERYWSLIHAPVPDADGSTRYILQRVEDVTDYVRFREERGATEHADDEWRQRLQTVEADLFVRMQELQLAREAERNASAALRTSEDRGRAVLETALDAILMIDGRGEIESTNPATERMFGWSAAEMVGRSVSQLLPAAGGTEPNELDEFHRTGRWNLVGSGLEMLGRRADGETVPLELTVSQVGSGTGLFACVVRDISERKQWELELARRALHDPLTGLANRTLLLDRVDHALVRLSRRPGVIALLFVDVDRFKQVNDRWGHQTGDELLKETAHRLLATVRAEDLVARIGGDEFVVLCEELHSADEAPLIAARVTQALSASAQIAGRRIDISASVGVVCDTGGRSALELLRAADADMYRVKQRLHAANPGPAAPAAATDAPGV